MKENKTFKGDIERAEHYVFCVRMAGIAVAALLIGYLLWGAL